MDLLDETKSSDKNASHVADIENSIESKESVQAIFKGIGGSSGRSTRRDTTVTLQRLQNAAWLVHSINGRRESGLADTWPSTSDDLSDSTAPVKVESSENTSCNINASKSASTGVSRSAAKRKAGSPKKRPQIFQTATNICAETGEVDEETVSENSNKFRIDDGIKQETCSPPPLASTASSSATDLAAAAAVSLQTFATVMGANVDPLLLGLPTRSPQSMSPNGINPFLPCSITNNYLNNIGTVNDILMKSAENTAALNAAVSNFIIASAGTAAKDSSAMSNANFLSAAAAASGMIPFFADSLQTNGSSRNHSRKNASESVAGMISGWLGPASPLEGTSNIVKQESIKGHPRRVRHRNVANIKVEPACEDAVQENVKEFKPNIAIKVEAQKRKSSVTNEEVSKSVACSITREERIDLEELESFAQTFKKQRIKFGFTQGDVGMALGRRYGTDFSQTTISRFEALNLSYKNMCKLRPLLKEWLNDAEAAIANGATVSDFLDSTPKGGPEFSGICCGTSSVVPCSVSSPSPKGPNFGISSIPLRKRRKRTNLDASQRTSLNAYFQLNPRPDHEKMAKIAEALGLDRDVVRVWFCNRRQKLRKQ